MKCEIFLAGFVYSVIAYNTHTALYTKNDIDCHFSCSYLFIYLFICIFIYWL